MSAAAASSVSAVSVTRPVPGHETEFSGASEGEHRAGVEEVLGVQGLLDLAMHAKADFADFAGEPLALDLADAVLARDRPAQGQTDLENRVEGLLRAGELVLGVGRVDDRGVHVAVTGVPDDGDPQPDLLADPLAAGDQFGDAGARHA